VEIGGQIAGIFLTHVVPALGTALGALVKLAGWVIEHVVPAVAGFISIAVTLASKFIELVSPAVSWLAEKVSELAGWITAHVVPAVGGFLDEAGKLATSLGNTLLNAVQWLIDKFTALKNFLVKTLSPVIDFIKGAFDAVRQTVGKLIDKVKEFLGMDTKKTIDVSFRETTANVLQDVKYMHLTNSLGESLGTNYWRGGLTRVNERGGEIMNLPSGTQIIPHDISEKMVGGNTNNTNVTVNVYGMDVRNPRQLGEIVAAEIMRQIRNTP
jgi:phage-related protein